MKEKDIYCFGLVFTACSVLGTSISLFLLFFIVFNRLSVVQVSFCGLIKWISPTICILCVPVKKIRVRLNLFVFEPIKMINRLYTRHKYYHYSHLVRLHTHTHTPYHRLPRTHTYTHPDISVFLTPSHKRAPQRERERERERENSKILILKDSSVRSIWTYLTASPCYTTNTNMHD